MKINRIPLAVLTLALPGLAWSLPGTQKACESLSNRADQILGATKSFSCEANEASSLMVDAATEQDYEQVHQAAFPENTYQGLPVVRKTSVIVSPRQAAAAAQESLKTASPINGLTAALDFDGSADRVPGSFMIAAGPPGSMPPGSTPPGSRPAGARPPGSRPPGSQPPGSQPPGSQPPGSQPPGTRPPVTRRPGGNDAPPPGSTPPPSRPTPVMRAPLPNYWNTVNWGAITPWNTLPFDWQEQHLESDNVLVSRWYEYDQHFTSVAGWTNETGEAIRNFNNQYQDLAVQVSNRQIINVKTAYYQTVYHWNSFYGRWDFDHHRAAYIRSQEFGGWNTRSFRVHFDMNGQTLQPWESERVVVAFDGSNVSARVDNAAFQYAQPYFSGDMITFPVVAKRLTPPDVNGVSAALINLGGALKVRINDRWAASYQGETLEIAVKVVRYKSSWNPFASNFEVINLTWDNGTQARWSPVTPPGVQAGFFDIDVPAYDSGKYKIESWAFRRVNNQDPNNQSRLTLGNPIHKGAGEWVPK